MDSQPLDHTDDRVMHDDDREGAGALVLAVLACILFALLLVTLLYWCREENRGFTSPSRPIESRVAVKSDAQGAQAD